jgi:fatty-acyl-CoA synthase
MVDDLYRRTSSLGRAHPHVEINIVYAVTGVVVDRGQTGEFCTRGYSVMLGYWADEEKTREAVDADAVRAFATGKLAHYKIPRYVMVVDDFPMTVTGKIRKVEMRMQSAKELGLNDDEEHG